MTSSEQAALAALPGAELVLPGLADLAAMAAGAPGTYTPEALLVAVGAPRLRAAGLAVPTAPNWPSTPELALYRAIGERHPEDAHSRYNSWVRRLVSFEQALERRASSERRSQSRSSIQCFTGTPPTRPAKCV